MFVLNTYNIASESSKTLAVALGIKRLRKQGSKFVGGAQHTVLNWGDSDPSVEVRKCNVINKPEAIELATNKRKFFEHIHEWNDGCAPQDYVGIVPHTTSTITAQDWIDHGHKVVCRTVLQGHSGEGIVIASTREELVPAPLYTFYKKKKSEWRVHVMNGEVIDIQRKCRDKDVPDDKVNWEVRNHQNGFIYARGVEAVGHVPHDVTAWALNAIKALGLDFGAVDLIYNEGRDETYVLEVNTAPGMQGQTGEIYAAAIKRHYNVG